MQQIDLIIASLSATWTEIAVFTPKIVIGVVILLLGWVGAKLARYATTHILKLTRFDALAQRSGLEAVLQQGEFNITLNRIISELVFWFVMLVVITTAAHEMGMQVVAELFNRFMFYLPNIIISILILVFGTLVARLANRFVFAYLHNLRMENALTISTIVEYAALVFVFFVALEQLQIGTHLLVSAFQIGFGSVCLALAIAFGLGGEDWAAGIITKVTAGKK
jgi:hypothetical protein